MQELVVAVDVGTSSARAGVFDRTGGLLGKTEHPILTNRPKPNFAEQDSEDIWRAVGNAVSGALQVSGAPANAVRGIGFDATCSLVVRDYQGQPLSVSEQEDGRWDTIAWFDHRAVSEAEACTGSGHPILDHLGGVMSPEMQTPKLMWLKRNLEQRWTRAGYFFDLADYLTWRASAALDRSQCTLACKWSYLAHLSPGWQPGFLECVGLSDLLEKGHLPIAAAPPGQDLGPLTQRSAGDLGLTTNCRVGVGLIDAHAGALGVLGKHLALGQSKGLAALIAGTSSSVVALSQTPVSGPGLWGPSFGAVLPNLWLTEGGQSATGALLDHIVRNHSAGGEPTRSMHGQIQERVAVLREQEGASFAADLHILPDFQGNRTPLADSQAFGVISGLALDSGFDDLCRLYWRTAVALALGTRQVLDTFADQGIVIDTLCAAGGLSNTPQLISLYADATGCSIVQPTTEDAVLLGSSMVAATAAGIYTDLTSAAEKMDRGGTTKPPDRAMAPYYDRDYRIFRLMQEQRQALEHIKRI